ncbi:MAG: ABC transporter substrate-binding protein [Firmicutes bacterium]|nr:ABC transporter substrate-binding protein [Sporosalibacterium faouarense]MTI48764.1 ABC transporter substrate-binding protein [Bacillota bacterium]
MLVALTFVSCSQDNKQVDTVNLLDEDWNTIIEKANGQTVNMHMWGGDEAVNKYIDQWVSPKLKSQFNIVLNRVPINDAKDMINKLLTEKQVEKEEGSIDIFWINGENFKNAKDNDLLLGSFVKKLPNYNMYIDNEADDLNYDFGQATEGMEAPWGKSQFVFIYDSEKIKNPPTTMDELKKWVKNNPGKFTYPAPPDFTGSAFIRNGIIEVTSGYESYMEDMDQESLLSKISPFWEYLNEIKPYLWREGKTYPESSGKLDQMYSNGEVWMTMSYNPVHAANRIKEGQFPQSTKTFVLEEGTLSNTHYLSIPYNSVNRAGALVAINFMLSPEAQIAKFNPNNWGDGLVISTEKLNEEDKAGLESIDRGDATLSPQELQIHRIPEMPSKYVDTIEKDWLENVAK